MSFKAALADPAADTGKQTQFYTMLGTRGIWHKGWFANTVHAATPAGWGHFDADRWELFHIEADRSQCHDLAGEHPDKLEELKALWFSEAAKYNGLPLSDLNIFETLTRTRPYLVSERDSYIYYPDCADVATGAAVEIRGRSFAVLADVTIDTTGAEGVLFKHGGGHGGHVLFIQDGRLHYVYNFLGERQQLVSSSAAIPLGQASVRRPLRPHRHRAKQPHAARRRHVVHRRRDGRHAGGCAVAPGNLRIGRCRHHGRTQRRFGRVQPVQGAVRIHRRHHRTGHRRSLRPAVRGRGKRIGAGLFA